MVAMFAMMISGWGQRDLTNPGVVDSVKLDEKQLRVHLSIFASDGFEGRETGEIGQRKAASYLEAYYGCSVLSPATTDLSFKWCPW